MFNSRLKKQFKSIEDRLDPYILELGEKKERLIELGEEISKIKENLPNVTENGDEVSNGVRSLEQMFSIISLTYIMIGYDSEMLAMLRMVKDKHKVHCYEASYNYMTNTKNLRSMNLMYLAILSNEVASDDATKVVQEVQQAIEVVDSLYDQCLELLKPKERL